MLKKLSKIAARNNCNPFKHYLYVRKSFATYEEKQHEADDVAAESKHNRRINELIGKYSEQEKQKICTILNNYTLKELLGYDISKTRANKLLAHRMRNGMLDLPDIFLVEGFGLKVADKFYKSLLQEPKTSADGLQMSLRAKTAPFVTPCIQAKLRANINSCIALRIGVNSITWSKLELVREENSNKPSQLTHWQHHEISEKKLHLSDLIKRCLYICHLIPQADCYLFENPQMAQASNNPGSVDQQNINIQKAQVTAMMGYALAERNVNVDPHPQADNEDNKKPLIYPTVFYLRRFLTARLFNHLVGTERVSTEETVMELMRTYYNQEDMEEMSLPRNDIGLHEIKPKEERKDVCNIQGNVQFPMELRHFYSKSQRVHRELLGQALLLNLTFVRLVLLQDSTSIARVSRGGKNSQDAKEQLEN